ncbi:MAG: transcriptional repressor [Thermoanaerobaculales bacterium]|nr:transcriptional repressor [Thermoanaerobaculales bacterium]
MAQRTRTRETRQRRVVYETIRSTHSHPTADWIFEKVRSEVPKVSLGTVYRNLAVLKDEGSIREILGTDRRAHYDADLSPHAHFICVDCGQILDVLGVPPIDWRTLKDLVGCEVTEQRHDFQGRCAACSLAAKAKGN